MDFEDDLGAQVPILNESFDEDKNIVWAVIDYILSMFHW
jgi:hypothetical protein